MERGRERSSMARALVLDREVRDGFVVGAGAGVEEGSGGAMVVGGARREVSVPVLLRGGIVV